MPKPRTAPASPPALAVELRVVLGSLRRRLRQEGGTGDFSATQFSVLGYLEREGPATVTRLAQAEGVRPQSMGATIGVLEAAGMVAGTPDPSDGRQTLLALTAAGRARILASRAARDDWLARAIKERLDPAQQQELARGLQHLQRLVR